MNDRKLILTALFGCVLLAASPAHADDGMGYAIGAGAAIPVGDGVSELAGAGPHLDGGVYYRILPIFAAGLHISWDLPMGKDLPSGQDVDFQFVGLTARGMYTGGAKLKYWAALGLGLFFNKASTCAGNICTTADEIKAGMDVNVGVGYAVWGPLVLGPSISLTFPSFGDMGDYMTLSLALRGHWNL